ncbi:DUF7453 family protein [Nitrospira sp. NS4]|uniref:DUF7453 family protein n=1 Tax=Nitrospira sp. NS4 TaxID=3414498 RepID=UPI003C2FB01E
MKHFQIYSSVFLSLLLLPAVSPRSTEAVPYVFEIIADNKGPINSFGQATINKSGIIAFGASKDGGGGGYFIANGGSLTEINARGTPPQINDGGTIVFNANNQSILTYTDGVTTTVADRAGIYSSLGVPSINDSGTVVFQTTLDTGGEGIFVSRDGVVTEIVNTRGQFNSFGLFADINNSGTVVFTGTLDTGEQGIFTAYNGQVSTISSRNASRVSINNEGTVAARIGDGSLFVSGSETNRFSDSFSNLIGAPALNNGNSIAFQSGSALFITDHLGNLESIVAPGDTIQNGITMVGLAGEHDYPGWLNDRGQVAFWAYLSDGSEAMIVASRVPEPSSFLLLFSGSLLFLLPSLRRRLSSSR